MNDALFRLPREPLLGCATLTQWESAQRQAHESAILQATAQVEAARLLLEQATAGGHETDFWRDALEWADDEEAQIRRASAKWSSRDREAHRRAFGFALALRERTTHHLAQMEKKAP